MTEERKKTPPRAGGRHETGGIIHNYEERHGPGGQAAAQRRGRGNQGRLAPQSGRRAGGDHAGTGAGEPLAGGSGAADAGAGQSGLCALTYIIIMGSLKLMVIT